jgi:hypothetical protein
VLDYNTPEQSVHTLGHIFKVNRGIENVGIFLYSRKLQKKMSV